MGAREALWPGLPVFIATVVTAYFTELVVIILVDQLPVKLTDAGMVVTNAWFAVTDSMSAMAMLAHVAPWIIALGGLLFFIGCAMLKQRTDDLEAY